MKASPTYTWLCAESFLSWKSSRRNLVGIQETCVFLWQETWCFYLGLKTDSSPNFTGVCHDPSISGKAALSHTHVQYAILITITVCLCFLLLWFKKKTDLKQLKKGKGYFIWLPGKSGRDSRRAGTLRQKLKKKLWRFCPCGLPSGIHFRSCAQGWH